MKIQLTHYSALRLKKALSRPGGFICTLALAVGKPFTRATTTPSIRVRLIVDVYEKHVEMVLRCGGSTHSQTITRTAPATLIETVSTWIVECIGDQGQERTGHAA